MKTKQIIERFLKHTDKYYYIELIKGSIESAQCTACENCGKLITNMVKVKRYSDEKILYIGTDCAETLARAGCLYNALNSDYRNDLYNYSQSEIFVREIKAGCKAEVVDSFWMELTNRKGKKIRVFKHQIEQYFPNYIK